MKAEKGGEETPGNGEPKPFKFKKHQPHNGRVPKQHDKT